jgi:translation initiation factor 2B subunit (eIF-2B alpha/beta/delta family)
MFSGVECGPMNAILDRIVQRVLDDRTSGASEVAVYVLDALDVALAEAGAPPSGVELKDFAVRLYRARMSMAPLFWISNLVLLSLEGDANPTSSLAILRREASGLKGSIERETPVINANAVQVLKGRRILTNSRSSTVLSAFEHSLRMGDIQVVVSESLPGGEGRMTAEYLADRGIEVELIPDTMIPLMMSSCDAAVVGADSIGREGVTNKVGTLAIALAGRSAGKPTHVLSGVSKLTPLRPGDLMRAEGHSRPHLTEIVQVFEVVPLNLFTSFVTDKGILYPDEVTRLLSERQLAPAWSEVGMPGK